MLTLPPVEPLSPAAAARAADVPFEWLIQEIAVDALPCDFVGDRPVLLSSDVELIAERYAERCARLKAMRARNSANR